MKRKHIRTNDFLRKARVGPTVGLTLMSQSEVAAELGISRPMVAVIEAKALAKLRRELSKRGVGPDCVEDFCEEWTPWIAIEEG